MNSNAKDEATPSRSNDSGVRFWRSPKGDFSTPTAELGGLKKRRGRAASRPKGEAPKQRLQKRYIYVVLVVFFMIFIVTLSGSFSIGYHNSRGFRTGLIANLEKGSGATVSLDQLRVSPTLASARAVEYRWDERAGFLSRVILKNVSSSYFVGGLLGGGWNGSALSAKAGSIYLKQMSVDEKDDAHKFDYKASYGLDRIKCSALDIYSSDGELLIKDCFAHFKWGIEPKLLQFSGGSLAYEDFGKLAVNQGYVKIGSDSNEFSLHLINEKGGGRVEVRGITGLSTSSPLALKVEGLSSEILFGDSLGDLVIGNWSGENGQFSIKQDFENGSKFEVQITTNNLDIGRLDCFAVLAEVLHNNDYRRPRFRKGGELHLTRDRAGVTLRDLSFNETRGLALSGSLSEKGGDVFGELRIGMPLHEKRILMKHFKEGVFSTSTDGYLWETVHISGKVGALKDDLRDKLRGQGEGPVEQIETPVESKINKAPLSQKGAEANLNEHIAK
ncbi:MAG: hypothetical protein ABGY95_11840 [Rubritalea sp.]|uniref:hypothetical protein n=1 Tax=Rubritalea sp. TaxID=2109375 RepID=UPI003242AE42